MKYIDAEKLITIIEERKAQQDQWINRYHDPINQGISQELTEIISLITSLQQEPEDKQIIIITESHGDANIKWDCRSLYDVIVLLKSAESFITEKQIEKIAGPGSGPDYATTEGRYSHLFKHKQEQPKFKVGDTIHKKEENTVFPMVIERISDGDYVCDNAHSFINIKYQDDYELVQQEQPDLPSGEDVMIMCNQILIDWVKEGKTQEEKEQREQAHIRFFELYDDYLMQEQPGVDF